MRFTENCVCANMPLKAKIRYRERNCPSKSPPISSQGFLESCIVQEKKLPVSFFPPMAMIFLSPSPAPRAQKTRKFKKRRQVPERAQRPACVSETVPRFESGLPLTPSRMSLKDWAPLVTRPVRGVKSGV